MSAYLHWLQHNHTVMAVVPWLRSTWLSQQMTGLPWMWPVCESLHFVGLALVIGIAGMFDLRMMGVIMRRVPVATVMQLRGWAGVGVTINLVTGLLFFIGAPAQYIGNSAFWWKVLFLFVAFVNILWFETTQGRKMLTLAPGDPIPFSHRLAGATSLFSWLMVLYWGRMLPFIGNAF